MLNTGFLCSFRLLEHALSAVLNGVYHSVVSSLSLVSCLISVCCTQLYRRACVGSVDFIGGVGEIPAMCDIVKFAQHEQLLYECLMCNDRSDSAVPRSLCAAITYYDYLVLVLVVIL